MQLPTWVPFRVESLWYNYKDAVFLVTLFGSIGYLIHGLFHHSEAIVIFGACGLACCVLWVLNEMWGSS